MKPKGLLKGNSSSDGDTVHPKVDPASSFLFKTSAGAHPKKTTKFTGPKAPNDLALSDPRTRVYP
jgi:hypothetical protein